MAEAATVQAQKVVVVDDEPRSVRSLVSELEAKGFSVECVTSPTALVETKSQRQDRPGADYSVVVLDLMFKRHDVNEGLVALRKIRTGKTPLRRDVPVVVYTQASEERAKCMAAGANGFFSKEPDVTAVLERVVGIAEGKLEEVAEVCNVLAIEGDSMLVEIHKDGMYFRKYIDQAIAPPEDRAVGATFQLITSVKRVRDRNHYEVHGESLPERADHEWERMIEELEEG